MAKDEINALGDVVITREESLGTQRSLLRCTEKDLAASGPGSLIRDGDHVIVYLKQDDTRHMIVNSRDSFNCRFGSFKMESWLGKPFGSKVESREGRFVYLLFPTPELWTQVLRHRTQILYTADISLITQMLELKPGSVGANGLMRRWEKQFCRAVLESGTGSGSLTHALARAVGPGGDVHTFEFHALRTAAAEAEFQSHNLGNLVHIQQRDIEGLGFPEQLHGMADAVFLDLPGPWKVVDSAAKCLRSDGVFCSFSPCVEQVHKTCAALSTASFYNVQVMECLLRQYEVRTAHLTVDVLGPSPAKSGPKRKRTDNGLPEVGEEQNKVTPKKEAITAKPLNEARGHTGYLTVARRIVREVQELEEVQQEPEAEFAEENQT